MGERGRCVKGVFVGRRGREGEGVGGGDVRRWFRIRDMCCFQNLSAYHHLSESKGSPRSLVEKKGCHGVQIELHFSKTGKNTDYVYNPLCSLLPTKSIS